MAAPAFLQELLKDNKAEYRRLGKSGLHISVPILGAMSFGSPEWAPWIIEEEQVCLEAPSQGIYLC
jgi:aryl-alcohol dehydrogenase-like predicted oxidoreductase